ncbi:MAG: twin-arginine translocase TatA/TatE family subunit [Ktedonobacteraceae bacterium]
MFGLHMPELIIILVVALLIFGPKKLPEMGSAIGRSIKEFRKGVNEISQPKEDKEEEVKEAEVRKVSPLESIERENVSKQSDFEIPHAVVERETVNSTDMRRD